jgi:hypothetical protein
MCISSGLVSRGCSRAPYPAGHLFTHSASDAVTRLTPPTPRLPERCASLARKRRCCNSTRDHAPDGRGPHRHVGVWVPALAQGCVLPLRLACQAGAGLLRGALSHITTAPYTYIRMHHGQEPAGGFTKEELKSWAAQVRALAASGKEVTSTSTMTGRDLRDAVTFERPSGLEGSPRAGDVHHLQDDGVLPGLTIPPTR